MPVPSAPADFRVVAYSAKYRQDVVDLLNRSLGPKLVGQRDVPYWIWKHEQSPFGASLLLLAEQDGKIIGLRPLLRWRFQSGGRLIEAAKPVDSVTDPDHQRRGIFRHLTTLACDQAREQGIQFLFNTPNNNSAPGYLKLGWQETGNLPLRMKVLRPFSFALRAAKWKVRSTPPPPTEEFFRGKPQSAGELLDNEQRMAPLLDDTDSSLWLTTDRNLAFFRWRYAQHPGIPYFAESIDRRGQRGAAAAVFYRTNFRGGLREIMIDDLLLAPSADANAAVEVLRKLRSQVRAEYMLVHFRAESPAARACRSFGFHPAPRRGIRLMTRSLATDNHLPISCVDNWSLCLGDLEGL